MTSIATSIRAAVRRLWSHLAPLRDRVEPLQVVADLCHRSRRELVVENATLRHQVRREILDHVIVLDDQHLGRLVAEYKEYFNEARPHQGIGQRIPGKPPAAIDITKPIVTKPVLGGLHHDYRRAA